MQVKDLQLERALRFALMAMLIGMAGLNNGYAERVEPEKAKKVAATFLSNNGAKSNQLTNLSEQAGFPNLYIFNGNPGFVILTADDRVKPVLGYSLTGRFVAENMPENLRWWLQGYNDEIQYAINNQLRGSVEAAQEWEELAQGKPNVAVRTVAVAPLITTEWGQGEPYNQKCPDGCVTGCVATAMAQIMKKWEWPEQGTGYHQYQWNGQTLEANFGETTYDWDNMTNTYGSSSTDAQKQAVATLMKHCGVSVEMNYGTNESEAFDNAVPNALKTYFDYADEAYFYERDSVDNDNVWKSIMKGELDAGRPMLYGGDSIGSHAFVCDGYSSGDYFHFNWGWNGENQSSYYSIDAMTPNDFFNFSRHQDAVFGIYPSDRGCYAPNILSGTLNGRTFTFSWEAVPGVASYRIYRNGEMIEAVATGTSYTDSNLEIGSYMYYMRSNCPDGSTSAISAFLPFEIEYTGDVTATIGDLCYSLNELTLTAEVIGHKNWSSASGSLNIPASVTFTNQFGQTHTYAVTSIGRDAFRGCSGFTGDLTIPSSVTTIGEDAFLNCSGFTGDLTIPSSVTTIGEDAFYNCSGFTGSLTIPNSVTSICNGTFCGCSSFTGNLTIPNSVTSIGDYAFSGCSGFTGSLTIPNSVILIGEGTFRNCSGFTGDLTIGNSVTSIGEEAFLNCSGFTGGLTIGNSVTTIGYKAFCGCSGFTGNLTIPNSVTSIGDYAFQNCSSFSMVVYNAVNCADISSDYYNYDAPFQGCGGSLVIGDDVERIPNYMFYHGAFTGSLTISNSVISIGRDAFRGCSGFTGDLTIPSSVTTIGEDAFYNCSGFTGDLTIPSSVTSIEGWAFSGCSGFTGNLSIPNSVTLISDGTFYGCSSFTGNLTIPNSVTTIGLRAFSGCSGFTGSLTIPNSVTSIGKEAFLNCSGFTGSLTIQNSVTSIDEEAFLNCSGFTGSLTIPNSVTSIGYRAFYNCSGFTGCLTISNSVTSIGGGAFCNCSGFSTVHYNAANCEVISYDSQPFQGCGSLLVIGNDVERIPNYMFRNGAFTGSLTIPNSVTTIGNSAFEGCNGFTGNLTIGNSVTTIGYSAFLGCRNLTAMKILSEAPPALGLSAFFSFPASIPVYVPCGTLSSYQEADGWSDFNNFHESTLAFMVTTSSKRAGKVTIEQFPSCTNNMVKAKAKPLLGHAFVGWRKEGLLVSLDTIYTTELTEDVEVEALFETNSNHYDFVGYGSWSDTANWEPKALPTETSTVGIWGSATVNVNATVASAAVYENNWLGVSPNVVLTVTETLESPRTSSISIFEGGQLVHVNEGVLATVAKSISPYTEGGNDGWHLMASPLAGNTAIADVQSMLSNEYDLYYYDEPTHYWRNHKQAENNFTELEAGKGYLYANKGYAIDNTTSYFPFYTGYEYSLGENLYRADELAAAGLGTNPINGLSWYATNGSEYEQNNISIWMANVSDEALATTSHLTAEMTLVYSGSMTPVLGWNEFAFNENTFAWDGTSNLLISVQRNNGVYGSTIYWQSHEADFTAMSYRYNYSTSYDATTTTYNMYTSTSRPNIIFKGATDVRIGEVQYNPITLYFEGELENGEATVNIPLSYTETAGSLKGFNLVGNPFVHNVTSYAATNVAEGCFRLNEAKDNIIVSEISETMPLKPAEGFFVKAIAEGASITFNAPTRGETKRCGFVNLELRENGPSTLQGASVTAGSGAFLIDRLIVKREGEPLEKLTLKGNGTRLFALKGHQEMAVAICEGNEQPINFKAAKNGTYTLLINVEGLELDYLHLIDNLTGADIDLLHPETLIAGEDPQSPTPSYTFEAKMSDDASRFKLMFSPVCE